MDSVHCSTPTINWNSQNLKHAWKRFKQHAKFMFSGPLSGKAETVKCSYLLLWVGEKSRDIFNTFTIAHSEQNVSAYLAKFDTYVKPVANPIFARYKFNKKNQDAVETVEQHVTSLKILTKDCSFGNSEDGMVRDRLLFGI
ncbi:hypothetical protein QYM36_010582 [Artemia franciscana]|uniref:Uncharacterized protein n=1 Tax=Artemia franciscana TaxID=6661 RepID=A0AA88L473_ARTSF|nr:hypothetical protein QYM36_010582 [Artemia franciscana]